MQNIISLKQVSTFITSLALINPAAANSGSISG